MNGSIGYGLMCKAPRPGVSKTRLAVSVGTDVAARLSRALLEDSVAAASTVAQELKLELTAFFRPADAAAEISSILGTQWQLVFADAGDLGATMLDAFRKMLDCNTDGALMTGADVPLMSTRDITAACLALRHTHAKGLVIQPSWDGGYCMIGIKCAKTAAPLFDPLPWSTSAVYEATLDRARALGFSITVLPRQRDIDDVSDLNWLRAQLAHEQVQAASTRRLLWSGDIALPSASTLVGA